jgi:hypothetical protein
MIRFMIKSLSRLVRQVFVGAHPQPTSKAVMGGDVPAPAHEGALRREDLKRAMELAFAAPLEPEAGVVVETVDVAEPLTRFADAGIEEEPVAEEMTQEPVPEEPAPQEPVPEVALPEEASLEAETEAEPVLAAIETEPVSASEPELDVAEEVQVTEVFVEEPVSEGASGESAPEEATAGDVVAGETAVAPPVECAAKPARAKKAAAKKKAAPKRKAAKKGAANAAGELPRDEVWVSDAVTYSLSGEWTTAWSPPEDSSGIERLKAFYAKAGEGLLTLWGRPDGADHWEPIKASFWKTGFVEPLSFVMGRDNLETDAKTASGKSKKGAKYHALKVSKAAVEELWPAPVRAEVRDAA